MADLGKCSECAAVGSSIGLDGSPFCDWCADRRLSSITGWPALPEPPAAEVMVGADVQKHFIDYRVIRLPARVLVLAEEINATASSGYLLEMDCGHFDDPGWLLSQIQEEMRAAIARPFLKTNELGSLDLTGEELGGYVEDDPDAENHGLPRVLIDGRSLTWEELASC